MECKSHVYILLDIISCLLFLIGSILFHPYFSASDSSYKAAVCIFTLGSIFFCLTSFQHLLADFHRLSNKENERTSLLVFDVDLGISLCRNTIGVINGFLFMIGSMAFWPTLGHSGVLVGNWLCRCGSTLGVISSTWSLIRLQTKSKTMTLMKLISLLSLLGSINFFIGGLFFLMGGNHNTEFSYFWALGSIAFLLSSILVYKL